MDVPTNFCPQPYPSYNLSLITTALSLFYSPTDPHTPPVNIEMLQKSLTHANLATKEIHNYMHLDFVWGRNAYLDVYSDNIARAAQYM